MELDEKIVKEYMDNEKYLSPYACLSKDAIRLGRENSENCHEFNVRPSFFRDVDRILHSTAYTRYMDKTQVFAFFDNDLITHRGLHVQFVSKIARTIGRALKLNEDLIEAISLGHDLGHVPYGHTGERCLNRVCQANDLGLFLHNVQSVRVLKDIENSGKGLNITLQVLDGILCHNGEMLNQRYEPDFNKTKEQFLKEYERASKEPGFDKTLKPTLIPLADKYKNLNFIFNDVLSVDLTEIESQFENNYVMIANLPYYITSQIIFRFLLQSNKISQMFVMVQKEVGERFCAKNSTKDYGIPTVLINSFGSAKIVKNVGKKMFTPMPKVDSCIIEIKIDKKKFEIKDNQKYCNFVSSCFKMKRKTLYNNLSAAGFEKNKIIEAIENINLNALVRPENLTAEQFVNLFNLLIFIFINYF